MIALALHDTIILIITHQSISTLNQLIQVPTAATKFIQLLEDNGVDFKGKLVQAVTSNVDDLCGVFSGDKDEITQGILIAGLGMGKIITKAAPNTKQELSGSNELICTSDQYKADTAGFIGALKMNLGYSGGKQCTAPSKMIFVGFKNKEIDDIQNQLQSWSDASEYVNMTNMEIGVGYVVCLEMWL